MANDIEDLLGRFKRLGESRASWDAHWQDLAEIFLPRRADFTVTHTPGDKRTERQFDGAPMQAARSLAAALDGLLKPKAQRWFFVKTADEALNRRDDVRAWLGAAENALHAAMYEPGARFLQRSGEVDLDLVVFGTGILYVGEKVGGRQLLFRSHHLKNCFVAENADGDIDTVFRTFTMTARQAAQAWGRDKLGAKTREALDDSAAVDKEFRFLHAVLPRDERDPSRRGNRDFPFASVFVDIDSEHKIGEGGYHEFPYIVPRWDTATDEVYGRSPAMIALPDANTLQAIGKTLLKAGQKAVDPPLLIPDDGVKAAPRTWPGGITYYDADLLGRSQGRPPIHPLQTGANIPLGREMQNDVRDQVWGAFFKNVLSLPVAGPQMTATEIIERKQEFLRVIGPTFGRLEADYTGPLIERVFAILSRAGLLPPPPPVLAGRNVQFEYVSPIARALRQIETAALKKTVEEIAPILSAEPDALDNFDTDRIVRDVAEANGLPQRWLRGVRDIAQLRAMKADAIGAEKAASDLERAAQAGAGIVKTLPVTS